MHDFVYVTKRSAQPVKNELIQIIQEVQDIVRPYFTFQPKPVGSSSMNMITYDRKSNIGFDLMTMMKIIVREKFAILCATQ